MPDVIWVDERDNVLGRVSLDKAHSEKLWHRIAVIFLFDKDRQLLVQNRVDGRLDSSCAGHVDWGESYDQAASRELREELGIDTELKELTPTPILKDITRFITTGSRHIYKIYSGIVPKNQEFKLKEDEVASVSWVNPQEVYQDVLNNWNNSKYTDGFKLALEKYINL